MNKDNKESKKIKILAHIDSMRAATGFGKVADGIFTNLAKTGRYDITIFAVNDIGGYYDQERYPYKIYPAMLAGVQGDFYGRLRFINVLRGVDLTIKPPWDIVFTLNDPFIFEEPVLTPEVGMMDAVHDIHNLYRDKMPPEAWFNVCSYWPVDSSLKENWIDHAVGLSDYSVAYNNYGKGEILKANEKLDKPFDFSDLPVIYHGVDTEVFHPVDEATKIEFRKKFFAKAKIDPISTFIVGIVARNQMRKDLPRAMKIFKEFQRRRPDSLLYIHAKEQDAWGSLGEYARQFKLELGRDWIFPGNFSENIGYPVEALNLIYNVMDVNLNSGLGEGFCTKPDTNIFTLNGFKEIKDINSEDSVYTQDGLFHKPKLLKRNYDGEMIKIHTNYTLPVSLTIGHKVYVVKNGRKAKKLMQSDIRKSKSIITMPTLEWVDVSEINEEDFLVFPLPKFNKKHNKIDLSKLKNTVIKKNYVFLKSRNQYNSEFIHPQSKPIPRYLKIDDEFLYICGLYIAEGSHGNGTVVFSLNSKEMGIVEKIKKYFIKFNFPINIMKMDRHRMNIQVNSTIFETLFAEFFGTRAENKKIPEWIMELPKDKLLTFVKALWDGDGAASIDTKYKMVQLEYSTVSKQLVAQLYLILMKIGLGPITIRKQIRESLPEWKVRISGKNNRNICKKFYDFKDNSILNIQKGWIDNKYVYLPIRTIEKEHYKGTVYNLSVSDNQTYVTQGFLVHNCLPIIEAMATKTLNMAPNHTSIPELFNTEDKDFDDPAKLAEDDTIRGIPIKNFSTSSEWVTHGPNDLERIRPLVNVDDAVKKLLWVYDNEDKVKEITERAYTWIQDYTWKKMADKWDELFQKVYNDLEKERLEAKKNAGSKDSDKSDRPESTLTKRDEPRSVPQTEGQSEIDRSVPIADSGGNT